MPDSDLGSVSIGHVEAKERVTRMLRAVLLSKDADASLADVQMTLDSEEVRETTILSDQAVFSSRLQTAAVNYALVYQPWWGLSNLTLLREVPVGSQVAVETLGYLTVTGGAYTAADRVFLTLNSGIYLPIQQAISVSPALDTFFTKGRTVTANISVKTQGVPIGQNQQVGGLNTAVIQDARGMLLMKPGALSQSSYTKKDGLLNVPAGEGVTIVLGPEIMDSLEPVNAALVFGEEKSGIVRNVISQLSSTGVAFRELASSNIGPFTAGSKVIQPANFTGAIFFTPFTISAQLTSLAGIPISTMSRVVVPDIGMNQTPIFEGDVQIPRIYCQNLDDGTGPAFKGSSANVFGAYATMTFLHCWMYYDVNQVLTLTTTEESFSFLPHLCNDSLRFIGVNTAGTVVSQFATFRFKTQALRPDPNVINTPVWVGSYWSGQVISDSAPNTTQTFEKTGAAAGDFTRNVANTPQGISTTTGAVTLIDAVNCRLLSVDFIAKNLYIPGRLGPIRIVTMIGIGAGVNIDISGSIINQLVTAAPLAPYDKAQSPSAPGASKVRLFLQRLWDSNNPNFKRIYRGTKDTDTNIYPRSEWHMVSEWTKNLKPEDLFGPFPANASKEYILFLGPLRHFAQAWLNEWMLGEAPLLQQEMQQQIFEPIREKKRGRELQGFDLFDQPDNMVSAGRYGNYDGNGAFGALAGLAGGLAPILAPIATNAIQGIASGLGSSLAGAMGNLFSAGNYQADDYDDDADEPMFSSSGRLPDYSFEQSLSGSHFPLLGGKKYRFEAGKNAGAFGDYDGYVLTPNMWEQLFRLAGISGSVPSYAGALGNMEQINRAFLNAFFTTGKTNPGQFVWPPDKDPKGWMWLTTANYHGLPDDMKDAVKSSDLYLAPSETAKPRLMMLHGYRKYKVGPAGGYVNKSGELVRPQQTLVRESLVQRHENDIAKLKMNFVVRGDADDPEKITFGIGKIRAAQSSAAAKLKIDYDNALRDLRAKFQQEVMQDHASELQRINRPANIVSFADDGQGLVWSKPSAAMYPTDRYVRPRKVRSGGEKVRWTPEAWRRAGGHLQQPAVGLGEEESEMPLSGFPSYASQSAAAPSTAMIPRQSRAVSFGGASSEDIQRRALGRFGPLPPTDLD